MTNFTLLVNMPSKNNCNTGLIMLNPIQTKDLIKNFDSFTLGPVNFNCAQGKLTTLLGKNGSGKSTFFSLITGSIEPTSGSIYIDREKMNLKAAHLRQKIGYLPQDISLPPWSTIEDLLFYTALVRKHSQPETAVKEALEFWDLTQYKNKIIHDCSYGMSKRAGLGVACIHNPNLLILDEPFSGLDVYHIHALKEILKLRKKNQLTTILSTHILPFAAELSDQIYYIQNGKMEYLELTSLDLKEKERFLEKKFLDFSTQ
jgi:ABC-type multidrug transport system ATPase subunit